MREGLRMTTTSKTTNQNLPQLLTKPEAAKALGMCTRSVELAVAKKALSVVRFGPRCIRFRFEDITRFIESRRVKAIGEGAAI
jgi:hypothetical protein